MTATNQSPVLPQIQKEVSTYAKGFKFNLNHLIFIAYFLAIFLRRFFYLGFSNLLLVSFWFSQLLQLVYWFGGGVLGWSFSVLDNIAYLYVTHPESVQAIQSKNLFMKSKLQWFKFLTTLDNIPHQISKSVLFQAAWVVLAGFAITSTVTGFGKGLVMGLGLKILLQNWQLQAKNPQTLNNQLFWQIKRPVSSEEQKKFLWIFSAVFILLTLLV